jgi:hypothetical protein
MTNFNENRCLSGGVLETDENINHQVLSEAYRFQVLNLNNNLINFLACEKVEDARLRRD